MMTKRSSLSYGALALATVLGACATNPQTASKPQPTSFDTPPAWLDRVSQVSYNPSKPEGPPALGDYENEPSRFYFQGVPLMASEDDQSYEDAAEAPSLPGDILSSRSFSGPGGG
jgi:hypothetical protein